MQICTLEQRSPDWAKWRLVGIGSSDAPVLWNGKHFGKTIDSLRHEKANALLGLKIKEGKTNSAMQRGIDSEGGILDRYRAWTGLTDSKPLCAVHDRYIWMKSSYDGICERKGKWIPCEAKTTGTRWDGTNDHYSALEGNIPEKYLPQLDHQLLVCGSTFAHYASYCPDFPAYDQFRVIPYEAPIERLNELLRLEMEFWWEIHDLAGIPLSPGSNLDFTVASWVRPVPSAA